MLSKMLSPSHPRTREETFTYIPFALLALWFTAFIFKAISNAPVFFTFPSTNNETNTYSTSNSTNQESQSQPQPSSILFSILILITHDLLVLITPLAFLFSFTYLVHHLNNLYPKWRFGAMALFLFGLSGSICFGIVVFNEGSSLFVLGYIESILWPGLGVMTVFVLGVLFYELVEYFDELERKRALEEGEVDVEDGAGTQAEIEEEDEDGSEVVVEEELERRLDKMEVDLEKVIGGTEGDDEEEGEVLGENEPMIRKGKEKEVDCEDGDRDEIAEAADDCEDAEFVEVPRK
jgi:hypothetical protein